MALVVVLPCKPATMNRVLCTHCVCGAGVAPIVNPASSLYDGDAFRTRHLLFDAEDPQATNPSGLPYAFRPLPFPGFPEGYTMWFDMGLPQPITQHRLQYLRDASFFSPRRADTATLQFAGIDVQRSTLALARLRLRWDDGGTIQASVTVVGMPLTTTAASAWVRSLPPPHPSARGSAPASYQGDRGATEPARPSPSALCKVEPHSLSDNPRFSKASMRVSG